jgi:hypothetical protein
VKKELLTELIEDFFAFSGENEGLDYTMQDFIGYLNAKKGIIRRDMSTIPGKKGNRFTDIYRNNAAGTYVPVRQGIYQKSSPGQSFADCR